MTEVEFARLFTDYLQNAARATEADRAEQQLVGLFRTFLARGFGVNDGEMLQEEAIHMVDLQRRGRTDLLVNNLIFEFKRARTFAVAERDQLRGYLAQISRDTGQPCTGLFTDGLRFEAYRLVPDGDGPVERFELFDAFNLAELSPANAFIRLDSYLFTQIARPPSAEDVVRRFGSSSPTFAQAFAALRALLDRVRHSPMLETWQVQWQRLLSRVYGSDVGDDELFLRHTYLCQFARLMGYAALSRSQADLPSTPTAMRAILDGSAFQRWGVANISENDFYSWVLMPDIADEALDLFQKLADSLVVYDLERIDQDLLKQLYQNLVDPKTRHELGEYYTPDWLAELTLDEIDYQSPRSLYDPACGSGSFLFSALKRLSEGGLRGRGLVNFAVNNIVGTDVHPLAVVIARVNYLLAIAEHLRVAGGGTQLLTIPVFMADALLRPLENLGERALLVKTRADLRDDEAFRVPYESTRSETALNALIDLTENFAENAQSGDPLNPPARMIEAYRKLVIERSVGAPSVDALNAWVANLRLLARLKHEDRNGIWSYILKNLARPLALAQRKFDAVVGNPPWLSYRYIKNRDYQADVKWLYQHYRLIDGGDVQLFTQMDLSTLFYAVARDRYLADDGALAFVMPRAVITGAKQHRPFQALGFTRVLDLLGVGPLFNVPTCVLIQRGPTHRDRVPATVYAGRLPSHELSLDIARPRLTTAPGEVRFVDSEVRSPYYYDKFFQGATLVPRNLCFVKPAGAVSSPAVISDPEANREAKAPYKGVSLSGVVADPYVYATLLSKHLLPFGYEKLHMVALPVRLGDDGALTLLPDAEAFADYGDFQTWEWFRAASATWDRLKKADSRMSLFERWDYQRTLVKQNPAAPYKVIYNASGVHLAACVIEVSGANLAILARPTQGFVVDHKVYYFDTTSIHEAHFLCAVLNTSSVNRAIKSYQSRGKGNVGERDIHRTPFEACAIPPFDPGDTRHAELAALSLAAHDDVSVIRHSPPRGGVVALRRAARTLADRQLRAIDRLATALLGLG